MRQAWDVVVIGGGVIGCAALFHLKLLGAGNVLLIERGTPGGGMTGRSMAILRMHYSNRVTVRMARASHAVISQFGEHTGRPGGFVKTGWMMLCNPGQEDALKRNVDLCTDEGVPVECLAPEAAARRWPNLDFTGTGAVAWEPESGYANSPAVTTGFAGRASELGARVLLGAGVTGFTAAGGRVTELITSHGNIPCGTVIIAANVWTNELLSGLGTRLPIGAVRHQVLRLHRPLDRLPDHPIIADLTGGGISFRPDAGDITLAAHREDPSPVVGFNPRVDQDAAAEALHRAAIRMPAFVEAGWDGGWAGLFDITPDWHPVIGRVPGWDNVVVGAGFSGHGFKLAPAVGLGLAEIALRGESLSIDMKELRFDRFEKGDLLRSSYGASVFA